jgi:probable rRNA maturation factor
MVNVQIRSDSRYPLDRKRVRALVERFLAAQRVTSQVVVSILVIGKRQMQQINRTYHGEDVATDVLSFPYLDPLSSKDEGKFVIANVEETPLGDIAVCYPVAVKEAARKGLLVDDEIDFLIEHGLNHLLGKHHD